VTSRAATPPPRARLERIEPIDVRPIELAPIGGPAPIAITAIAIDRIDITAMP
jgi:hypothetical protein